MKKSLLGFSFLALGSLVLAACGSPEAPSSSAESSEPLSTSSSASPLLKAKGVEFYVSATKHSPLQLAFAESLPGIPFIGLSTAVEFLKAPGQESGGSAYSLTLKDVNGVISLTRENGSEAVFDFPNKTLSFSSFEAFSAMPFATSPLDPVSLNLQDTAGKTLYLEHDKTASTINHPGTSLLLDLSRYDIPLVYEAGEGYIPLQLFSDFFFSQLANPLAYNGEAVFMSSGSLGDMITPYYSMGARSRSAALISYNYHELCLALDVYYGLKKEHGIGDFASYLSASGLKDELLSTDSVAAATALMKLTNEHFEDFHSAFLAPSSFAGQGSVTATSSPDYAAQRATMVRFKTARKLVLGFTPETYHEEGDTAFVTFDEFTGLEGDYYTNPPTSDLLLPAEDTVPSPDTFALIAYAHSQITRSGSPIKNVVIDLSCNTGGALDSLAYVAGWLMNSDVLDVESGIDAMRTENSYAVDVNFDKVFDAADCISTKRLYCLVSPSSFSCGNYLPSMLKIRQKATLIGETSGGGGCMVKALTTADGSFFQLSGNLEMRVSKNGTFVDIDQGMSPDYRLGELKAFYDRPTLAKDIDDGVYGALYAS